MKPSLNIQRFPVSQISKTAFRLAASAAIFVITLFCSVPAYADSNLWRKINESDLLLVKSRESKPKSYGVFELNSSTLSQALAKTSKERFDNAAMSDDSVVTLPLPDGRFWRFKIEESAIMSPELSAKYPEIRNYSGQGIDDPTATMRINWTPKGLNAYVAASQFTFLVVPYSESSSQYYLSYFSQDENGDAFKCSTSNFTPAGENNLSGEDHLTITGSVLRRYRLAISVTRQFYLASGENDAAAVAAVTNFVSNINVIYERELTIRFDIVYMAFDRLGTVFPPNQDLGQANEINQFQLDRLIGTGAYDIGHLLGYNAPMPNGLVSVLGSLCQPSKAKGGTVLSQNIYWGSVVFAHEVGHQLGAVHTWGLGSGLCNAGQFAPGGWFEPGSGSTLMSYAGICGNSNLQPVSNDYFHVDSLFKIVSLIDSPPMLACAQRTITGNSPPVVSGASSNSTIPALTPFTLTASASDANGDALLYNWEQYNLGTPFFRSYLPSPNPSRTFPSPFYILNYGNSPPAFFNGFASGEFMPTTSGTFGFWLTVRDARAGGGGISTQQQFLQITVNAAAGPFTVTQPNTNVSWGAGSQQVVTWNVANTNSPPIGTANVRILLSTDGGNTFPIVLAANTANDGAHTVTIPNMQTTTARIKVEAVGNIYFDISNTNFRIGSTTAPRRRFDFDGDGKADVAIFRPSNRVWYRLIRTNHTFVSEQFGVSTDRITPADFDGDGKTDIAVYRPSTGYWYRINSSTNTFVPFQWGAPGDIPAPADYDGDGTDDFAVFRPSNGVWYMYNSSNGFNAVNWGVPGDVPLPGDYDGDRKAEQVVFRPTTGTWYLNRTQQGFYAHKWGVSSDKPTPGDFDGDGKMEIAVFRPSTGFWYGWNAQTAQFFAVNWGAPGDIPVPADYDGDNYFDLAVFRPSDGIWYLWQSSQGFESFRFGWAGDIPAESAYVP